MKQIDVIEFPGESYIFDNIDYFKNKFINDSVIVFRNANFNYEQQDKFHLKIGKAFGWNSIKDTDNGFYVENHSSNALLDTAGPDDIMLGWHIEHVYGANPICAATWNMYKFNSNENNGKTYFIDTSKIYKDLSEDWQEFLDECTAISLNSSDADTVKLDNYNEYNVIQKHWITGDSVIRIPFRKGINYLDMLSKYKQESPTLKQKEKFFEICTYINNKIWNDKSVVLFHKWRRGDLLIPDMFKLAHAVTGGFNPTDREFSGKWGYQYPI